MILGGFTCLPSQRNKRQSRPESIMFNFQLLPVGRGPRSLLLAVLCCRQSLGIHACGLCTLVGPSRVVVPLFSWLALYRPRPAATTLTPFTEHGQDSSGGMGFPGFPTSSFSHTHNPHTHRAHRRPLFLHAPEVSLGLALSVTRSRARLCRRT